MISDGFKFEFDWEFEDSGKVSGSRFYLDDKPSAALRTLILDSYPVVSFIVRDFCQLSAAALHNAPLQIEAVETVLRVKIDVVFVWHCLSA